MSATEKWIKAPRSSVPMPMKLFGAWEVDKTPPNCIPRLCTLTINRLVLLKVPTPSSSSSNSSQAVDAVTDLVIAVKMTNSKRVLRSNEFSITVPVPGTASNNGPQPMTPSTPGSMSNGPNANPLTSPLSAATPTTITPAIPSNLDTTLNNLSLSERFNANSVVQVPLEADLDLTFALQYPHFLKKNGNQLQVLLQRRKRYKNRAILGHKTLAGGSINMNEVLQRSHSMDKRLELRENCKDIRKSDVMATIVMSNLRSQPVDHEGGSSHHRGQKMSLNESNDADSDEEGDDFSASEGSDSEPAEEGPKGNKWRPSRPSRTKKIGENPHVHQRNLKQRFIALLKKFKMPDSEASDSEEQAALERELMQRQRQLEGMDDIFEFDDSDVDSMQEFDDISMVSTPRPGLKPFFSSKTTLVEEATDVGDKRHGTRSRWDKDSLPIASSPKPSLRPFFSTSKNTLTSQQHEDMMGVEVNEPESSGTEHTPDTSDTSLKMSGFMEDHASNMATITPLVQPTPNVKSKGRDGEKSGDKKSKAKDKDRSSEGKDRSKNQVKETISRLLRK